MSRDTRRLQGAPNFRDLGGHATSDGRRVRFGRIFRSQGFHALESEDLGALQDLDLGLVCDLRSTMERRRLPNRLPAESRAVILELDVSTDARANHHEFLDAVRADPTPQGVRTGMIINYRNMPRAFATVLPKLFAQLQDERQLPAVIHCHAGKDRTGFVSALLLYLLGVPKGAIYADYLRTAELLDLDALAAEMSVVFGENTGMNLDATAVRPIVEVHPEYLDAALQQINIEYGSIDSYLSREGAVDPRGRERLRELLLE